MPVHDYQCGSCGELVADVFLPSLFPDLRHFQCGGKLEIKWSLRAPGTGIWHPKSRMVVFRDPRTGKVAYPMRNDAPMPERYARRGFERVEISDGATARRFEKEQGVISHVLNFDRNGKSVDDAKEEKPIDMTGVEI